MLQRTTIRLNPDLLRRAKARAAAEGRSLTSLIEEGLRRVVSVAPEKKALRSFSLPVSKARGGPRPGVDLTRTSELLDMLDDDLPPEQRR